MSLSQLKRSYALPVVAFAGIGVLWCNAGSMAYQKAPKDDAGAAAERSYPSLPGAVRECPEWLKKNAPFDVAEWFQVVPPEENAAPLYLDALYEFAPQDMAKCMAPAIVAARGAAIHDRAARTGVGLTANPPALSSDLVAEHIVAFDKIKLAQRHKRCVFETGIGFEALLPHAQASRAVVRVLDWRVEYAVANGQIDEAIADIGMGLRLSRDLRPRGYLICQLVSIALDSVILQSPVSKILSARGQTIAQCDRLLQILGRHSDEAVDSLSEGFRAEYVALRETLHQFEIGGDPAETPTPDDDTKLARAILRQFTAADFEAELDALNDYFRLLSKFPKQSLREIDKLQPELQRALDKLKALKPFLVSLPQAVAARQRDLTRLAGTRCLVAVRRWQLDHDGKSPPNLLTACVAAGMIAVPIDEYSPTGEPLRYISIDGEFIVYSVAQDGLDDGAKQDWNYGRTPGDWIFRLPPLR